MDTIEAIDTTIERLKNTDREYVYTDSLRCGVAFLFATVTGLDPTETREEHHPAWGDKIELPVNNPFDFAWNTPKGMEYKQVILGINSALGTPSESPWGISNVIGDYGDTHPETSSRECAIAVFQMARDNIVKMTAETPVD